MEIFSTFQTKLTKSNAKLIDGNTLNTLAWMCSTNQKQILDIVDDVSEKLREDARYDGSSDHIAKLRRLSWLDEMLDEQKAALTAGEAHYLDQYGEKWVARNAAPVKGADAVKNKYFAKA